MKARNALISNLQSQIENLTTNQGVLGSNPAGRAIFALNSMACRQKLRAIFLCCAIEQNFGIEWHTVRADRLGSKGFASRTRRGSASCSTRDSPPIYFENGEYRNPSGDGVGAR